MERSRGARREVFNVLDPKERACRAAAAERAHQYRAQADAFRRLATIEPLEQRRRLLALSATKYDEAARAEERIAYGARRLGRRALREAEPPV
jgi:hypothetical protein